VEISDFSHKTAVHVRVRLDCGRNLRFCVEMTDDSVSIEESHHIAEAIREELARRRKTRVWLAETAKLSLSTLEKSLSGTRPFTLASLVRVEEAMGLSLRRVQAKAMDAALAPENLGSYSRLAVKWLEGSYLTLRPSFSVEKAVYAYRTEIIWDTTRSHLVFRESERLDTAYKQEGSVSVPHQSGHVYLVTNKIGQMRLCILSRPMIGGEMFGLLSTLQSGKGAALTPISVPLVLAPVKNFGGAPRFGLIKPDDELHGAYAKLLRRATDDQFVILQGE
jgi:DNA-binding phage protein